MNVKKKHCGQYSLITFSLAVGVDCIKIIIFCRLIAFELDWSLTKATFVIKTLSGVEYGTGI